MPGSIQACSKRGRWMLYGPFEWPRPSHTSAAPVTAAPVSTTIVESGLDISTANTLIIHRADMFGLAQLYQLRGRVGRSKTRAYALFTVPANRTITPQAQKRLEVLQSLDSLGAGFTRSFDRHMHDGAVKNAGSLVAQSVSHLLGARALLGCGQHQGATCAQGVDFAYGVGALHNRGNMITHTVEYRRV